MLGLAISTPEILLDFLSRAFSLSLILHGAQFAARACAQLGFSIYKRAWMSGGCTPPAGLSIVDLLDWRSPPERRVVGNTHLRMCRAPLQLRESRIT